MDDFRPVAWLPGRHLQSIVPSFWPAPAIGGEDESRIVRVAEGAAVRVHAARPRGHARGTLLLVHGMGGSAESSYMRWTARMALARGWIAVRMNCRNCGGTEALSNTLYNAGQSDDIGRVLHDLERAGFPRPFVAAGFSLGGALVLSYAGRADRSSAADAIAAVNPPIDLEACCRALERPRNTLYHAHFTLSLCRLLRRIRRARPADGPAPAFRTIRTLRRFDTRFTAPDAGYSSAEEYYAGASAAPDLGRVAVPALVLSSANDPLVPMEMFAAHVPTGPSPLRFLFTRAGGHLGYWQPGELRPWGSVAVLRFFDEALRAR